MREVEHGFRAMNTDVRVVIVVTDDRRGARAACRAVEDLFARVEATLSRFRPESELSRLNRQAGAPFPASPLLWTVVGAALAAARETHGTFDPTILRALVAAGYDRSFDDVPRDAPRPPDSVTPRPSAWDEIALDDGDQTITLPPAVGLDLGGIAKGWTVDRAAELLASFAGFGVDAGGDLYCHGRQADGRPWTVGVEDPRNPDRDLIVLAIHDHGVATSTSARRTWRRGLDQMHHLIDPRTGQPSTSDVLSATVVAPAVARAEVLAKVALLLGSTEGRAFLDEATDAAELLVLRDGRTLTSARFRELVDVW